MTVVDHNKITATVTPNQRDANKLWRTIQSEVAAFQPRLALVYILSAPLPRLVANRLRVYILRAVGFQIGHGTMMAGTPIITGTGNLVERLSIGEHCMFNAGCTLDLEDKITIGHGVGIGQEVMILTSSHQIGPRGRRAGEVLRAPVTIGDGAWLGARCTILPGVTIGAGSIIGAGMVINRDVPEDTLVSGTQRISLARWRK